MDRGAPDADRKREGIVSESPEAWDAEQAAAEDEESRERAAEADEGLAPGSMPPEGEPPFSDAAA